MGAVRLRSSSGQTRATCKPATPSRAVEDTAAARRWSSASRCSRRLADRKLAGRDGSLTHFPGHLF